jgi:hypothetical protein
VLHFQMEFTERVSYSSHKEKIKYCFTRLLLGVFINDKRVWIRGGSRIRGQVNFKEFFQFSQLKKSPGNDFCKWADQGGCRGCAPPSGRKCPFSGRKCPFCRRMQFSNQNFPQKRHLFIAQNQTFSPEKNLLFCN